MLNGNYTQSGSVSLIGSNGTTVSLAENVTGDVRITGSVSAQGEGSAGLRVLGDVAGEFMIGGSVAATGFTSTQITNYVDPDELKTGDPTIAQRRDAEDLLVGGSAVEIRGDLARGFLVNGNAVGGADPTDDVRMWFRISTRTARPATSRRMAPRQPC